MKNDALSIIKRNPLLFGVNDKTLDKLLCSDGVRTETFEGDEIAYSQKTEGGEIAFVISGAARVYSGAEGENALLRTIHESDVFGVANLYCESESFPSRIITSERTELLFIDRTIFKHFIESDSVLLKNYLEFQSKKIMYLNKKISVFTAGSAEKKLAFFMLDHINGNCFTSPSSMSRLADMLGIGRASLYRAIDQLSLEGIIIERRKNDMIVNVEKLKNYK